MNLTDYFDAVDYAQITSGILPLGKYSLGPVIEKSSETINQKSLIKTDVVLLGVPAVNGKRQKKGYSSPDKIRSSLYRLASFEGTLRIVDLGNLKSSKSQKGTFLALRDIVEYLLAMKTVVVVLGGSQELTLGICEAFRNERFFWLTVVDAVLDVKKGTETFSSKNYLSRLFRAFPRLFQFSLLGYQQHLTGTQVIKKTADSANHLRLGELRDDVTQAELLLRNTNVLSFDMGAIRYLDAPASGQKNPNGLHGEEACQLARYAGISPKLSVFGLFEALTENDKEGITASLAAEIIWYFIKGVSLRKQAEIKTAYKVEIEGLDHPVVFRHERESDRWWFDVTSLSGEVIEIACSEEEYRQAAANEIPERWLKFLQKMDNHLK